MKSAVVTGVSSGIGLGITRVLLANGWRVFGSVRKEADADRLTKELGAGFSPLMFDITDAEAVARAASLVRAQLGGNSLDGLVNNSGMSVPGPLLHLPIDEFRRQLEVNVTGQLIVTQAFAPMLGADPSLKGAPGRIVNITSVAGKIFTPFLGAYVASKHALEGLSDVLRVELRLYGIDVIVIGPGAVQSEIWRKGDEDARGVFDGTPYGAAMQKFGAFALEAGRKGLPATRIGEIVLKVFTVRKPRLRYAVVPDRLQTWTLPRLMPKRALTAFMANWLGLKHG